MLVCCAAESAMLNTILSILALVEGRYASKCNKVAFSPLPDDGCLVNVSAAWCSEGSPRAPLQNFGVRVVGYEEM